MSWFEVWVNGKLKHTEQGEDLDTVKGKYTKLYPHMSVAVFKARKTDAELYALNKAKRQD